VADNRFLSKSIGAETIQETEYVPTVKQATTCFVTALSEGSAGSDSTFNEDYSSTSSTTGIRFTTQDAVVLGLIFTLQDGDVAQNAVVNNHELFIGAASALTNGMTVKTANSAGTAVHTIISAGFKTIGAIAGFATDFVQSFDVSSATTTNNNHCIAFKIDFTQLLGHGIYLKKNEYIQVLLNDNFSGLSVFTISAYGYTFF
jgi:hypothetical protein